MALIPEDRKTEGLMLPMSVRDNLSFAALDRLSRRRRRHRVGARTAADRPTMVRKLSIKVAPSSTTRWRRCRAATSRRS